MVCILGEIIQESGVKLAKEISCQMQGMAKRNLLRNEAYGVYRVFPVL